MKNHPLKGNLFENMLVVELVKQKYNQAQENNMYFFGIVTQMKQISLIPEAEGLFAVEIKSVQTIIPNFFKGLEYFKRVAKDKVLERYIIYGGVSEQKRSNAHIVGFKNCYNIIKITE